MENISVFNSIIDIINNIINLVKYLFDLNWLLGIVAGFICIIFIFYALFAFLLYFIYASFQDGHYLQAIGGIIVLAYLYWYGKKNEEKTTDSSDNDTSTTQKAKDSFENNHSDNHKKFEDYSDDSNINNDTGSISWSYSILGCQPDEPLEKIKQAYRELAKQYHPDGFHNKPQEFIDIANKRMDEINRAYKTICGMHGEH